MTYIIKYPADTDIRELDKKPSPKPDDEELSSFMQSLGETIAMWQIIESRLLSVYMTCMETSNQNTVAASFNTIVTFRQRLQTINAVVASSRLPDEAKEDWVKLSDKLNKKSSRRNSIAHGVVCFEPAQKGRNKRIHISEPPKVSAKASGKNENIISRKDLSDMKEAFTKLNDEVHIFTFKVFQFYKPPQGYP